MPETVPQNPALRYVELLTTALTIAGVGLPAVMGAVRGAISVFRDLHPELPVPTDTEVIEALRSTASINIDIKQAWLRANGFAD